MKEIKFLKDLAIRLTNTNKVIDVVGGDIYYDTDGTRYGYVTFKNTSKSPIFSLQLFIREYNVDGVFIKDNELFDAYCYYPVGEFVINNPIVFDKETEAIDITIVKITFNNRNFINDRFVGFKDSDYADLFQRKAPVKKPGSGTVFTFSNAPRPAARPVAEEAPLDAEQPTAASGEAPVDEAIEQAPVREAPAPQPEVPVSEITSFGKAQKDFFRYIPVAVALLVIVVMAFIIMSAVTGGVNAFNEGYIY